MIDKTTLLRRAQAVGFPPAVYGGRVVGGSESGWRHLVATESESALLEIGAQLVSHEERLRRNEAFLERERAREMRQRQLGLTRPPERGFTRLHPDQ